MKKFFLLSLFLTMQAFAGKCMHCEKMANSKTAQQKDAKTFFVMTFSTNVKDFDYWKDLGDKNLELAFKYRSNYIKAYHCYKEAKKTNDKLGSNPLKELSGNKKAMNYFKARSKKNKAWQPIFDELEKLNKSNNN